MKIIFRLFQRDSYAGIRFNCKFFCIYFFLLMVLVLQMYFQQMNNTNAQWLDIFSNIFAGEKELSIYSDDAMFHIPIHWLFFQMGVVLSNFLYPIHELQQSGESYIMKSRSRGKWWISKCLWVVENTLMFLLMFYGVLFILCLILGLPLTFVGQDIWGINLEYAKISSILIKLLFMPILSSLCLGEMVLVLSLLFKPAVSLFLMFAIFAICTYQTIIFLPCNYTMLYRYNKTLEGTSVNYKTGLCVIGIFIILSITIGYFAIKRKDIYKGRN